MRPQKLSPDEIETQIAALSGWQQYGNAITKTYTFAMFMDGIAFVNQLAEAAERADHHPDLDIRYNKITVSLSTHDAEGITQNDFDLARAADSLV